MKAIKYFSVLIIYEMIKDHIPYPNKLFRKNLAAKLLLQMIY